MTQAVPSRHSNAGLGWRLSFGTLFPQNFPYEMDSHGIYVGPDGGVHLLFATLHAGDPAVSGVSYTQDGATARRPTWEPSGSRLLIPRWLPASAARAVNGASSVPKQTAAIRVL